MDHKENAVLRYSRRFWIGQTSLGAFAASGMVSSGKTAQRAFRGALGKHRNLFNGDSCVYFYNPELWQPEGLPYTAKAIHRYVALLARSGVDTFLINPNAQVAWYPSKKHQTILDSYKRGDGEFFRGHALAVNVKPEEMDAYLDGQVRFFNLYLDLVEAGVDWLAETSKACREHGVSPWVTMRMNDMHGAKNPTGSHFNCALFKDDKYRLSGRIMDPRDGNYFYWAGLNYERPEVRDFMMSFVREWLEDYDFEGLELDWLRNPNCCEPVAGPRVRNLMTDWIAEIRAHTEARAQRLGRPCPLGLRIPASLGYMKDIGVDVVRLAREGIIDFVAFSDFWQTTWDLPYDELRSLLGPDVAIYGVVEDAPNWIRARAPEFERKAPSTAAGLPPVLGIRYLSASAPMLRANAAGKLALGVDGIEQFNFFCTDQPKVPGLRADYAALNQIDRLEFLRGKPKHYCLETPSGNVSMAWEWPEQLPAVIEAKRRRAFRLSMCAEPREARLVAQIVLAKPAEEPEIGVSFNGRWPVFEKRATAELLFPVGPYTEHLAENQAYNFELDAAGIRAGWNSILVINNNKRDERGEKSIRVVSVELGVMA